MKYVCTSCKAEDHDNSTLSIFLPQVLNCWQCGVGQGLEVTKMVRAGVGMYPVPEEKSEQKRVS